MNFEWDLEKAHSNLRKHGVNYQEAMTVFKDPLALIFDDEAHSEKEHREIIVGTSALSSIVLVCFVERVEDTIRIFQRPPGDEKRDQRL